IILISPSLAFAQVATSTATSTPALDPFNQTDVITAVANYFADIPVMANIAKCESDDTQYNSNGTVLNGGSGGMIGVFQINASVHKAFALTLGDDITTLAGNMAYARYLYDNSGTQPWDSSKSCWGNKVVPVAKAIVNEVIQAAKSAVLPDMTIAHAQTVATTSIATATPAIATQTLTQNLKLGSVSSQVTLLQQLLNGDGYYIAKSGAASPGQETTTFGPATKLAVERFQCT